jgi:hypothetical protein
MPAPPFRARFLQLVHEHLARRMPELIARSAQTRRSATEAQKIRVAHFLESGARSVELECLEAYGTHEDWPYYPCSLL